MKPSVLFVGNFLSATVGNRAVCEELTDRLRTGGWNVLTTSSRPGRAARMADMLGTIVRRRREYQAAHIDVYSGPSFLWAEGAALTLRRLGKPYALTLHGGALPEFAERWPRRTRRLLRSAVSVTAPSGYLLERLRSYGSGLRLLPNAIDLERYTFRLRERAHPRLVWVRAFHAIYDPSLAIRVLAMVRRRHPDATLEMAGPDKHDGSFDAARATAAELGVTEAVRFAGAVPKAEIARWIDRGDIFLNTSFIDNAPVSVVEAMACGASIVSTNAGGIPYLLHDNDDALLVPPHDPEPMAAAVDRLVSSPPLAARLSRAARLQAERFDWSLILPQWNDLLMAVANT